MIPIFSAISRLAPKDGTGQLTIAGALNLLGNAKTVIEVAGINPGEFDTLAATGPFRAGLNLEVDFAKSPVAMPGRYEFISAPVLSAYPAVTPVALSPIRELQYFSSDPAAFVVVGIGTPFEEWAVASGLTLGVDAGKGDDPNHDGVPNIFHFAFDTDPLAIGGGDEGKRRLVGDRRTVRIDQLDEEGLVAFFDHVTQYRDLNR